MPKKLHAQQVNEYIKKRKPTPVCDLCIAKNVRLSVRAHANQITAALATTSEFVREKGLCSECKRSDVMVIRAVDPAQASEASVLNFESVVVEFGSVTIKVIR